MLFEFLRYLQPTHYFALQRQSSYFVYPDPSTLPETVLSQLESDSDFVDNRSTQYDLAWQAIHKGYIGGAKTLSNIEAVPLQDEYRFIGKYFNRVWVAYVLLIRILSFKNPVRELRAWRASRHVKRSTYLKQPVHYPDWETFESKLLESAPRVSVIIPTLNRYTWLKDVLHDLEQQDYKNFEVLIVDQSEPYDTSFYKDFKLNIAVRYQKEKALWLARNTAIKQAQGDCLLFFDDDSRVAPDWIAMHLKCLDFFKADVSSGVSISKVGAEVPAHYRFFKVSDQLDTGNALVKRYVFERVGLFDRQFEKQRMGDGEFGLRVYLNDFLNVSNPYAKRLHLKVDRGGLRDMGSWDAFRTKAWFAPRPIPSVLYFFRHYFGKKRSCYALLRSVPFSIMPYRFKKNKPMLVLGALVCIVIFPLVVFQVCKSWYLSGKKLKMGPLIESL
ncbi:glycosyltransferase family 2 protein [Snuella sedimenti]|uniref:Glycosyltransferase family 2 protein n=1 Tax=Snuella sedimenti TaxID=2798802 RepID=A0A8J7IVU6_9FLAO|nr:glycosyltransferase family A protein [Snuella sedimenti]MBJ6367915.1 glycosyltransferase family 2 protein [Snuella sedimenti]